MSEKTNTDFRFDRSEFVTRGNAATDEQIAAGVNLLVLAAGTKGAEGMCTALATLKPKAVIPYHHHSCGEVMIPLRGAAVAEVEGRQYILRPYDALFVPAGINHTVRNALAEESMLHVSFPNAAPDRILVDNTYEVVDPTEHPQDLTPESRMRFEEANIYELAPQTAFRDLFAKRLGASGVCGGYGLFQPGSSLPCHIHDYDESISIVEGEAVCQVAGGEHTLSHNDTACIPRGRPHRFINRSERPMAMIWVYAGDEPDREIVEQIHCDIPPQI